MTDTGTQLNWWQAVLIGLLGVSAFHVAYGVEAVGGLVVVYLACWFALAWAPSRRWAFYLGLALGLLTFAPQLGFFWRLFGAAAAPLWAILALWQALFLVLARGATQRWRRWGALALPVLWLACEYCRSEVYALRFAWLTPGLALSHPFWRGWLVFGVYGFSAVVLAGLALLVVVPASWRRAVALGEVALLSVALAVRPLAPPAVAAGPFVAGVQLEDEVDDGAIVRALDRLVAVYPETDIAVLSEYTFGGPVPPVVRAWARRTAKYLIVGGTEPAGGPEQFYNTAFVIGPDGAVVFRQVKCVPIQFFHDGLPAPVQGVWASPWGPLGLLVCYDLSYTRVVDGLLAQGARALIVPTMDRVEWGARQHTLHAKVAPVRAAECGIGVFRLASSGISQLVLPGGRVVATAPLPGSGAMLGGRLPLAAPRRPWDRWLAWPAVLLTAAVGAGLLASRPRAF